jgi:hypothetical protein
LSAETTKKQIGTLKKNGMSSKNAPDEVISKMKSIGLEMMKNRGSTGDSAVTKLVAKMDKFAETKNKDDENILKNDSQEDAVPNFTHLFQK